MNKLLARLELTPLSTLGKPASFNTSCFIDLIGKNDRIEVQIAPIKQLITRVCNVGGAQNWLIVSLDDGLDLSTQNNCVLYMALDCIR